MIFVQFSSESSFRRFVDERERRESFSFMTRKSSESGLISSICFWSIVDFRDEIFIISLVNNFLEKIPSLIERERDQRSMLADIVRLVLCKVACEVFFLLSIDCECPNIICIWSFSCEKRTGVILTELCRFNLARLFKRTDFEIRDEARPFFMIIAFLVSFRFKSFMLSLSSESVSLSELSILIMPLPLPSRRFL